MQITGVNFIIYSAVVLPTSNLKTLENLFFLKYEKSIFIENKFVCAKKLALNLHLQIPTLKKRIEKIRRYFKLCLFYLI